MVNRKKTHFDLDQGNKTHRFHDSSTSDWFQWNCNQKFKMTNEQCTPYGFFLFNLKLTREHCRKWN